MFTLIACSNGIGTVFISVIIFTDDHIFVQHFTILLNGLNNFRRFNSELRRIFISFVQPYSQVIGIYR